MRSHLSLLCLLSWATNQSWALLNSNIESFSHRKESILLEKPLSSFEKKATTLKLLSEGKFHNILADDKNAKKFEASAVTQVQDKYYVIFDSLEAIAAVDIFDSKSDSNVLHGALGKDSGYEGIEYDSENGHFFLLIEAEKSKPLLDQVQIIGADVEFIQQCSFDYTFSHENKGFEGLVLGARDTTLEPRYVFALCEGNYCSGGKKGRSQGNGRIVVFQRTQRKEKCHWQFVQEISIPKHVAFTDYSDIDYDGNRIAITSQEDAMMWVTDAVIVGPDIEFAPTGGKFYSFPRSKKGHIVYCNIEGVQLNEDTVVVVSDKFKKSKQHKRCAEKDQSIHRFAL
eukprot:CFRG0684T1